MISSSAETTAGRLILWTCGLLLSVAAGAQEARPVAPVGVDAYDLELRVKQSRIPAAELLPEQPTAKANIRVDPKTVIAELNPLFIGYNIEDLSHAFFPGPVRPDALWRELRGRTGRRPSGRLGGMAGADHVRNAEGTGAPSQMAWSMVLRERRSDAHRQPPAPYLYQSRPDDQRDGPVRVDAAEVRAQPVGAGLAGLLEAGIVLLRLPFS